MVVAINQPTYFPWMGYFELIAKADIFVYLDCVQYVHHEWNNRNRLKGSNSESFWISVPVKKCQLETPIYDITIANDPPNKKWRKKHIMAITSALGKAPYFKSLWSKLENILMREISNLSELNIALIKAISNNLGIEKQMYRASEFKTSGKRTELILDICKTFSATEYYSPAGAAIYLEKEKYLFDNNGIIVTYQNFQHPKYPQQFGHFISHMSILDPLMNIGIEKTRKLLIKNE
ncbi:WbqC-like protein family [Candidatus Magnetomorum sp. HK-1]|nr:WbqC-like protein family [Candidatus Magnetomorum sp. HK-1]